MVFVSLLSKSDSMKLSELHVGGKAVVTQVGGDGALRQHFLDMGLIPGTVVRLMKYAPMGDPLQIMLHGYLLSLRKADAAQIEISMDVSEIEEQEKPHSMRPHPGLGEEGERFHDTRTEHPLPKGHKLTFALVGNQNCGKTTLFNQLTGSNQHVGNFPGVTVDRKSGPIRGYAYTEVTDLPGIYSLSPYTAEEIVSRNFVLEEKPNAIINILDATNIERNLYLTMQLMELNIPMVIALNMMDEIEGNGGAVLINEMEFSLGVPVVPISAAKNQGVDELIKHAIHIARYQEAPKRQDFCNAHEHGGAMHRCLHAVMHFIEDHAEQAGLPVRFAASKLVEGDSLIERSLGLEENEKATIRHILKQLQGERGLDPAAAIADMRFNFIRQLCLKCVAKPKQNKEQKRSVAIDKVLTGKYTAHLSFLVIMGLVFWLTFNVIGDFLQTELQNLIDWGTAELDQLLKSLRVTPLIHSLLIDGVCQGVGSVVSFLPIIVCLFFFLSILEDTGYMARIAFVMDMLLRKIGLSGRSIVPLLIGFGCSVPAVMATRTLPSQRDRKLTILLTPFMSCTAKLPVYGLFCAAFFPHQAAWIMLSLYVFGILAGIVEAILLRIIYFQGNAVPFVMELPSYRMPGVRNVFLLLWEKAKDFLQRAFTVIFLASIVIWFLQHFNFSLVMVEDPSKSILANVAGLLAPLFEPLGFGDWRFVTALASGFIAKESVVGTLGVLFPTEQAMKALLTPTIAYVLLIFCLLYTPCVAAIASIRRELAPKWAWAVVISQCLIAWICAFVVSLILN